MPSSFVVLRGLNVAERRHPRFSAKVLTAGVFHVQEGHNSMQAKPRTLQTSLKPPNLVVTYQLERYLQPTLPVPDPAGWLLNADKVYEVRSGKCL